MLGGERILHSETRARPARFWEPSEPSYGSTQQHSSELTQSDAAPVQGSIRFGRIPVSALTVGMALSAASRVS